MREEVKARLNRERLAINGDDIERAKTHHGEIIVTPAATTSPQMDSMLASANYIATRFLEKMKENLDRGNDDYFPDSRDRKEFREICKTIHSQARVYIDLEKHKQTQRSNWDKPKLRELVSQTLYRRNHSPKVVADVLDALKLSPKTSGSAYPTSESDLLTETTSRKSRSSSDDF